MDGEPGNSAGGLRQPTWLIATGIAFGAVAILAGFAAAMFNERMDGFARAATWLLLAFGIAASSHVFAGEMTIEIPQKMRAGGAFALFVFVVLTSPARESVERIIWPPNPKPAADAMLSALDAMAPSHAWTLLSKWAQERYPQPEFTQLFDTVRRPAGTPASRSYFGTQALEAPPGLPQGVYQVFTYRTTFATPPLVAMENVMVGTEGGTWRVFGYNIVPAPQAPTQ